MANAHKKLLRAIRHQHSLRENRQMAKKIHRGFLRLSENCNERVINAVNSMGDRAQYIPSFNNTCLPNVFLYRVNNRKK